MDYFEIFSLPRKLAIDTAALEKQFYVLSRKFHPDRFAAKPVAEQDAATEQSSRLNDGYRALKDPVRRTEYLLELEGVELEEQSVKATEAARAGGVAKKQVVPPELLEEAFELNMQLEEMKMAKKVGEDDPQLRADLEKAKANFTGMMTEATEQLATLWSAWDAGMDAGDESAKVKARDGMLALLNKRSYIRNLVRDVNEALE